MYTLRTSLQTLVYVLIPSYIYNDIHVHDICYFLTLDIIVVIIINWTHYQGLFSVSCSE